MDLGRELEEAFVTRHGPGDRYYGFDMLDYLLDLPPEVRIALARELLPDTHQVVPCEPTKEMIGAWLEASHGADRWRVTLAAAPKAEGEDA